MAYRNDLEASRLNAQRLLDENRALRARLAGARPTRSRVGISLVALFWTMSALTAAFLGVASANDDARAPSAFDEITIGDVVTPASGSDVGDVRAPPPAP